MSERRIKDAFDAITPSVEVKQSLLENILAAAAEAEQAEPAEQPERAEQAEQLDTPAIPLASKWRTRSKLFDVALPLAACLVLLAGIGSLTLPDLLIDPGRHTPAPSEVVDDLPAPAPSEVVEDLPAPSTDANPPAAALDPVKERSAFFFIGVAAIVISLVSLATWGILRLTQRRKE
jgi:hypothetical protein